MAWIRTVAEGEAEGQLGKIYRAAIERAGKVFGILKVQSLDAGILDASMRLYMATTTHPRSPLPRWFRELVAVTVSRLNHCRYWVLAHEEDLRAEAPADVVEVLLSADPRPALDPALRALLDYVHKVTLDPASCREEDVRALRAAGATDEQIHATVQVAAYFAYINRIADALGVDFEPGM